MATELKHTVKPTGGDYNTLSGAIEHLKSAHANLVTADVYATIEIDGTWSSADTTAVAVSGLTTDATHYLRIYTTAAARHQGVWSSSYYQLITSNATAITSTSVSNVYYDGLQIGHSSENANFQNCIYFTGSVTATTNRLVVSNTITRAANNNSYRVPSIQCECANQLVYVYNWIDYGHGTDANAYNCGFFIGNGAATIYSSTVIGGYGGIYRGGGTITAKNTYAYGSNAAWNGVGASLTMTNCSGNDTTPEDTDPLDSVALNTDTFVNVTYATANYHLAADGLSPLQGAGTSTTGDSAPMNFTTDIDGQTRDATWDIGADAAYAAGETEAAAGTVDATTGVTGAARMNRAAKGSMASAATVVAVACVLKAVMGVSGATSGVSAKAYQAFSVRGTVAATSSVTGVASVLRPAAGTFDDTSSVAAVASVLRPVAGAIGATSSVTGAASVLRSAAGSVAATSSVAGAASTETIHLAAGSIAATSGVTARGILNYSAVATSLNAVSSITGRASQTIYAHATLASASSFTAQASRTIYAKGTLAAASTVTGTCSSYSLGYLWARINGSWVGMGSLSAGTPGSGGGDADGGTW